MDRCTESSGNAATAASRVSGHGGAAVVTSTSVPETSARTSSTFRTAIERLFQFA